MIDHGLKNCAWAAALALLSCEVGIHINGDVIMSLPCPILQLSCSNDVFQENLTAGNIVNFIKKAITDSASVIMTEVSLILMLCHVDLDCSI